MNTILDGRTPLVLVAGMSETTTPTARALLRAGTVLVHHDLSHVREGVVRRTITTVAGTTVTGTTVAGNTVSERETILELAHGCVSCTLSQDLLPLLRRLHARSSVARIVVLLDPQLEPEALCWAIEHVVVAGVVGQLDGPAERDVRVDAVVTCIDAESWLSDALSDEALDDDRTLAQVVVGQVEFADALVVRGMADLDSWRHTRLRAVLARLAPRAPVVDAGGDIEKVLLAVPEDSRRGELADAHSPLLRFQPPLEEDSGVMLVEFTANRPFHPGRLHDAIDVLLDGVVCSRGRVWVATQPGEALWLESAGGGLRVASADTWLAAMIPEELEGVPVERRALAALKWDDRFGDRDTSMVVLVCDANPLEIDRTLQHALVTDEELADEKSWSTWDDPFGEFHEDPCDESQSPYAETESTREANE
ncbi:MULTISPECIES: ribosome hibernation factor-recruiting GTPase MRF [Rhodococcus]|uniref:ribosome hibernation factor-recruiting GTPase MRF n=1 Tax=Rhodococcus globerulus TaxID=33008 RepID=UPI001FD52F4B|nr:GTP-binding protein [Rhodococcus globerulus]